VAGVKKGTELATKNIQKGWFRRKKYIEASEIENSYAWVRKRGV